MINVFSKIREELENLIKESKENVVKFDEKHNIKKISGLNYQIWYTKALPIVKRLVPERYEEFRECYKLKESPAELDLQNYTISDYFMSIPVLDLLGEPEFNPKDAFWDRFACQRGILSGALARLDSVLRDITGILQSNLFDNELDAAENLLNTGYIRAAGVIAGVVLEGHLKTIINNHQIEITQKDSGISHLNEKLKEENIYDIVQWRKIQQLTDIRNYCGHKKEREPTKDEVKELIEGTRKIIKNVI